MILLIFDVFVCVLMRVIFKISGERLAPNAFFIITEYFYNSLTNNFRLKNFSIGTIHTAIGELQRKEGGQSKNEATKKMVLRSTLFVGMSRSIINHGFFFQAALDRVNGRNFEAKKV